MLNLRYKWKFKAGGVKAGKNVFVSVSGIRLWNTLCIELKECVVIK